MWAFKNNDALFWSRFTMLSGALYLENTSTCVCYILKYRCAADFLKADSIQFCIYFAFVETCLLSMPILLFLEILFLHAKPVAAFFLPIHQPNKDSVFTMTGINYPLKTIDIFKKMDDLEER